MHSVYSVEEINEVLALLDSVESVLREAYADSDAIEGVQKARSMLTAVAQNNEVDEKERSRLSVTAYWKGRDAHSLWMREGQGRETCFWILNGCIAEAWGIVKHVAEMCEKPRPFIISQLRVALRAVHNSVDAFIRCRTIIPRLPDVEAARVATRERQLIVEDAQREFDWRAGDYGPIKRPRIAQPPRWPNTYHVNAEMRAELEVLGQDYKNARATERAILDGLPDPSPARGAALFTYRGTEIVLSHRICGESYE